MRLNDINAEITFNLWMKPALNEGPLKTGLGYIDPDNDGQAYKLRFDGKQCKVLLRDASSGNDLNFHLKRGCARLAEVMQLAADGSAFVKIIFFNGEIVEIGNVEIGIDDHIEHTARKNGIRFRGAEELCSVLTEKCKIRANDEDFFLLLSGPSAKSDFESENQDDDDQSDPQPFLQEKYREFSVFGERIRIPVGRRNIDNATEIYFAARAVFRDNQVREGALRLAKGTVVFSDYTKTGRIRALAAGAMSQLTKEAGSFMKQWDEYGAIEGEMLLARAKAVGKIKYTGTEKTLKGVKFFVSFVPDQLREGDQLEFTAEEPLYIKNPDMTWQEFSQVVEEEFNAKKEFKKNNADNNRTPDPASILNLTKTSIELDLPAIPSGQMFLVLSITGDKVQIERRSRARSAILEGRCANPLLGLVIEEGGILPEIQRVTKLKPLTPLVIDKIFKNPPTDKQVEAIEIALNTPDIALIQGPPGTGKTTVITAILERLNEEYDKTNSIRGQILVSGFQHDAVENVVSRLSINALPAVKFGKRSSDSEFAGNAITEKINKWCSKVADNIRSENPQIARTEDQVRLGELFTAYELCPSKNNTANLVDRILNLPRDVISEAITSKAEVIINSLQAEMDTTDTSILRIIRSLRISTSAFEDDGPARATDLLDKIEDELSNPDRDILEKAARWNSGKSLDFIPELKALKESLLYRYLPSPDFRTEKIREDVLGLVREVSQILEKKLNLTDRRSSILAEFLHELEDNPDGIREAIEDYNFVYAATTQQSEGSDIRRAKTKFNEEKIKYDSVIIDEAARTSPRDLLIPMSQAEKRIILVGDHRQLPHLIDEEVARVLEGDSPSFPHVDVDFIKKSMFAYLFSRAKKLEEMDGIKRTVTLDAQYRTHPLLGEFVSENFYRQYDEGYRSPLSAKLFKHNLRGIENKAAIWINVPNSQGKETVLPSRSKRRISEATVIAEYVDKWIKSVEGSGLSFGIISFYKAQVSAVYEALKKYQITERMQDGAWQIAEAYRSLDNGEERLRIGTVDAFQGMEFDVVFLSMVRTQDINALPPHIRNEKDYKKKQQKIFGHLMSENRLCVSMSRQKKVLAIVGDGLFVNTQMALDAIPALKNFYDLCNERGVIL